MPWRCRLYQPDRQDRTEHYIAYNIFYFTPAAQMRLLTVSGALLLTVKSFSYQETAVQAYHCSSLGAALCG